MTDVSKLNGVSLTMTTQILFSSRSSVCSSLASGRSCSSTIVNHSWNILHRLQTKAAHCSKRIFGLNYCFIQPVSPWSGLRLWCHFFCVLSYTECGRGEVCEGGGRTGRERVTEEECCIHTQSHFSALSSLNRQAASLLPLLSDFFFFTHGPNMDAV